MALLIQLSPYTIIENNWILLTNSFLGHDSTMRKISHIKANSLVGGNVTLGNGSYVGTNATIKENINIDNLSIVDLKPLFLSDVPSKSIFVGNPGRLLKKKT
jgi:acetyltransferase-like isoleucine patch superfamily enzyme